MADESWNSPICETCGQMVESRSVQRRKAIQRGERMPTFTPAPATAEKVVPAVTLARVAFELHGQHRLAPYNFQSFQQCEHNICAEARAALERSGK